MASFSKFVKVCVCWGGGGGTSKVVSYKYEGAAPHAVAYCFFFNTESGSVDEAWKKKRTCIVLL